MNNEFLKSLSRQLADDPSLLARVEDEELRALLLDHAAGLLDPAEAAETAAFIASDPDAAAIWAKYQAVLSYLESEAGKNWLNEPPEALLRRFESREKLRAVHTDDSPTGAEQPQALPERKHKVYHVSFRLTGMGIAAQTEPRYGAQVRAFSVVGTDFVLLFLPQPGTSQLIIEVHTTANEPSCAFDGATVWFREKAYPITNGRVIIQSNPIEFEFRLTTAGDVEMQLEELK